MLDISKLRSAISRLTADCIHLESVLRGDHRQITMTLMPEYSVDAGGRGVRA
jgi:hypothetical protein